MHNENSNIFPIFYNKKEKIRLYPNHEKILINKINWDDSLYILPAPEFFGNELLMFYTKEYINDEHIMSIYIRNNFKPTKDRYICLTELFDPYQCVKIVKKGSEREPIYEPVYDVFVHKPLAIGIRANYAFDIKEFYTTIYLNWGRLDYRYKEKVLLVI